MIERAENDPSAIATIQSGLAAFNTTQGFGDAGNEPLVLVVREDGGVIGGLIGRTHWGWLYVQQLWVGSCHRGLGWGAQLLAAAEAEARTRGCVGVYLDTFLETNAAFYEHCGYQRCGAIENFPPDHTRIFLKKML